jgi:hypothetical protein
MTFSLLPLLLHEDVPASVLVELRKASAVPDGERRTHLEAAAKALYRDAHLDCDDARELVGL